VAAILLAAGLLPPYAEMWKRHGRVIGINWVFISMDWCGAFFSLMALGTLPHLPISQLLGLLWEADGRRAFCVQWRKTLLISWAVSYILSGELKSNHPYHSTAIRSTLTVPSCILELGIFLSHIIWRIRTRKMRKAAAADGKTFDDLLAEHEERGEAFKWADRKFRKGKKAAQTSDEETGYATEEKLSPCEPSSPVTPAFRGGHGSEP
jgi:hypothetical protein